MSRIEEMNYHRDRRVLAGMPDFVTFDEGAMKLIVTDEDSEGNEVEFTLPAKFVVCDCCAGKGHHVNPSIDAGGLTAEDFDRDPGFREDYFSGVYDETCRECEGRRVVPVPDEGRCPAGSVLLQRYNELVQDDYDDRRERAYERAMGA
jgi:hypothetical protein